jgi:alpha-L-rhamnosidase
VQPGGEFGEGPRPAQIRVQQLHGSDDDGVRPSAGFGGPVAVRSDRAGQVAEHPVLPGREAAAIIGRTDEAEHFHALADRTRTAFTKHYVSADGQVRSDCPTVYALAICFELLDGPLRQRAGGRLATLVAENGYRVATGFAGTPYVTDALTDTGHLDHAYRLLRQCECPSWLYPVTMGATTVWERWDAMLPDGPHQPRRDDQLQPLHTRSGRRLDAPRDRRRRPGRAGLSHRAGRAPPRRGHITWADTELDSPHGRIAVNWRLAPNGQLDVQSSCPKA